MERDGRLTLHTARRFVDPALPELFVLVPKACGRAWRVGASIPAEIGFRVGGHSSDPVAVLDLEVGQELELSHAPRVCIETIDMSQSGRRARVTLRVLSLLDDDAGVPKRPRGPPRI